MSRTVGGALATHLAGAVTSVTTLVRIQRVDLPDGSSGTITGLTSHDADIVFDDGDGSLTYKSAAGYSRSAVSGSGEMAVDTIDFKGLFNSAGITSEDFLVGRMNFAAVRLHLVNWSDLTQGSVILRQGTIGQVTTTEDFVAELRGMMQAFLQEIVEVTSQTCRAKFGDADETSPRCYIDLVGLPWSKSLPTTKRLAADAKNETVVRPTAANDRWFVSTIVGLTGPAEPAWDTTIGNTTTETLTVAVWASATAYAANEQILANSLIWVSDGGTSGGGEPVWTSNPGDTIADNDIIWTAFANTPTIWETIQGRRIEAVIATIVNDMEITVTPTVATDAPDSFFGAGRIVFTSGNNNDIVFGISSWTLSTKTIKIFLPTPLTMTVGDGLTIIAGCDRVNTTCEDDYDNKINFRGEDYLPGLMQMLKFPNQPTG